MAMSIEIFSLLKYAISYFITLLLVPNILLKSSLKLIPKIIISIMLISISMFLVIHSNGINRSTISYLVVLFISILYITYKVVCKIFKSHKNQ